ncbi:MAG: hypothetical protein JW938_02375 [Candidatus Omnitrophica bacterium]|nr:hypothetical protein [Candidatus Omnitrophota bacterium]
MKIIVFSVIMLTMVVSIGYAAVGCTLNDPDRDIQRLFPEVTNYKTEFITIEERGGETLAKEIQEKLGDTFDPLYESLDVPYAFYTVLKGKDIIGYVHGVNQKGMYGGMQLILATDPEGKIIDFYYQKLSSPESKKFRSDAFTKQFVGLCLADFYARDLKGEIKDPSENSKQDYEATLRGLKKNLILYDEFMLGNRFDKEFILKEVSNAYAQ